MGRSHVLNRLLAGRWQVPLALCGVVAACIALYRLKPARQPVAFDALLADVIALREAGAYADAADAAANLLEVEPPFLPAQQAALHDVLAEIIYRAEGARATPNSDNVRLLIKHDEAATELGLAPDAGRLLRAARAQEWLGARVRAISRYRQVLERAPLPDERRRALQGLVRLLEVEPGAEAERRGLLEELLADEDLSDAYAWWALRQAIGEALARGQSERAWELLARHAGRFKRSDLKGYYRYLRAWLLVREGRYEEAEPLLGWVERWLASEAGAAGRLAGSSDLAALCRNLRGQIDLGEQRPQAALAEFGAAQRLAPYGDVLVGATVGRARALALLARHAAARRVLEETIARLAAEAAPARGLRRIRDVLLVLSEQCSERSEYENAIGYLRLAQGLVPESQALRVELLDKLGALYKLAGGQAGDEDRGRHYHAEAARQYEQAAELTVLDEPRHAGFLWSAAQQYDQAGRLEDARRLLLRFVAGRELDPRLPQALLQLGQAYEADGELEQALSWYQAVVARYPELEEAARGRLYSAGCLMALGVDRWGEAEALLGGLLEDERIAPGASVFRQALLALCDLLYQEGRYAEVISRLEDFLELYPQDAERLPNRFLLADAYRRSAYRLRDDPPEGQTAARVRAESLARFRRAAELFGEFLRAVRAGSDRDAALLLYARLSLFYQADCLVELGEAPALREALALYREAAARYEREPAALTAQVQIANIYLRQGKLREAARAVERARWLLRNMPDAVFVEYADGTDRAYWDRYLTAVSSSRLLRDAFVDSR